MLDSGFDSGQIEFGIRCPGHEASGRTMATCARVQFKTHSPIGRRSAV